MSTEGERVATTLPRALVLDRAWRATATDHTPGLDPLSNATGGPLSRTVKLILEPLVIRPGQRPELAATALTPDAAAELTDILADAGTVLSHTAAWFTVLKRARRGAGITEGHPQDLYFQRAFELATVHGEPTEPDGARLAGEVLAEVHHAGPSVARLREHLADPATRAEHADRLSRRWSARSDDDTSAEAPGTETPAPEPAGSESAATPYLAGADPAGADPIRPTHRLAAAPVLDDADQAAARWQDLVDADAGAGLGRHWWFAGGAARVDGTSVHDLPPAPEIGEHASTSDLALPLDRSIYERVFTLVRSASGRDELGDISDVVTDEVDRAASPCGYTDPTLRAGLLVGVELAHRLRPIESIGRPGSAPGSELERRINRRWQREAYVWQARRLPIDGDREAGGVLGDVAREVAAPAPRYVRRLWSRLHGRDARSRPFADHEEALDVLEGVALSVIRDHRDRVRGALSRLGDATAPQPDAQAVPQ
ncbi:hypothetical protein [Occultella gossypii]|uniref:Uncharacterized protein n=1 Tax=Occultella gossypii TaxID=2800820 RepID=A0ABS7SER7_9MICO|nr:hypothetical protein [Occultella gossypii]MBZ2198858.1 hypothetical protein [Occultella gossypii]